VPDADRLRALVGYGLTSGHRFHITPWQTTYGFFRRWAKAGVANYIRDQLRRAIRLRAGRCPNPAAAIIDSQSVRAAATVTGPSRSYDAGK
jgi:transposase